MSRSSRRTALTPEKLEVIKKRKEKRKIAENERKLKNAGIWLFGVAVLLAISAAVTYIPNTQYIEFIIDASMPLIFVGLGIWSRTKPYEAILTGLILFTLIIVLSAIADPSSIFSGILWKVLIYSALIKGLAVARNNKKVLANDDIIDDIEFE